MTKLVVRPWFPRCKGVFLYLSRKKALPLHTTVTTGKLNTHNNTHVGPIAKWLGCLAQKREVAGSSLHSEWIPIGELARSQYKCVAFLGPIYQLYMYVLL